MARGVGGGGVERLFVGGDYFKYVDQRGAIIRGRRLIEGRLLFEEIRYLTSPETALKFMSVIGPFACMKP